MSILSRSMATRLETDLKIPLGIMVLMVAQVACVTFFVADVLADYREQAALGYETLHLGVEAAATLGLVAAILFEGWFLLDLLRRKSRLEHSLNLASAAVHDVIEMHFTAWKLSPSETDVATFLVKGMGISEIAELRGCAEGTVKAHLNAIYRKSGTANRGELLSTLIDGLLGENVRT